MTTVYFQSPFTYLCANKVDMTCNIKQLHNDNFRNMSGNIVLIFVLIQFAGADTGFRKAGGVRVTVKYY